MKAFVVFAVILAVASARVLRAPQISTVLDMQKEHKMGKIIGGNPATLGQFPWQSSLHMDQSYICGGSLISPNWILTAAHCVDGFSSYQMALGRLNWNDFNYAGTQSQYHPNWDSSTISNDVGLVRVSTSVGLTDNIQPSTLPVGITDQLVGVGVTVSGWGKTSDSGSVSPTLNWVTLTTISNAACQDFYGSIIGPGTLCTAQQSGQSTCNGDSGGPLIRTSDQIQVGVVSFVSSAGCTAGPHGFARLPYFVDWVLANTDA